MDKGTKFRRAKRDLWARLHSLRCSCDHQIERLDSGGVVNVRPLFAEATEVLSQAIRFEMLEAERER